jgi:hypothetical protein
VSLSLSVTKDSDRAKIISKAVDVVDKPIQNRASEYLIFYGYFYVCIGELPLAKELEAS